MEDIKRNGVVDVRDLQLWFKVLLGAETDPIILERADVNDDDSINEMDLEMVLEMILENTYLLAPTSIHPKE